MGKNNTKNYEDQWRVTEDNINEYSFICPYWMRHLLSQRGICDCYKEFWCSYFKFYDWLVERWYKFFYESDIKKSWIDEFKSIKKSISNICN